MLMANDYSVLKALSNTTKGEDNRIIDVAEFTEPVKAFHAFGALSAAVFPLIPDTDYTLDMAEFNKTMAQSFCAAFTEEQLEASVNERAPIKMTPLRLTELLCTASFTNKARPTMILLNAAGSCCGTFCSAALFSPLIVSFTSVVHVFSAKKSLVPENHHKYNFLQTMLAEGTLEAYAAKSLSIDYSIKNLVRYSPVEVALLPIIRPLSQDAPLAGQNGLMGVICKYELKLCVPNAFCDIQVDDDGRRGGDVITDFLSEIVPSSNEPVSELEDESVEEAVRE